LIKKNTWGIRTETVATKAFRTFITIYFLLKSERLSVSTKLILYKALIMPGPPGSLRPTAIF